MTQQYFRVMIEHEGYPFIEQDGLDLEEATDMLKRKQDFYPDDIWWIEEDMEWEQRQAQELSREYERSSADGWEDLFSTDEG